MKKRYERAFLIAVSVCVFFLLMAQPAESVVRRHTGTSNNLIEATGTDITGGTAQTYTFPSLVGGAYVWLHPDSTATMYVKWNPSTAASATSWDAVLVAGGIEFVQIDGDITGGIPVTTVSVFSATSQTLDTNFVVKGIQFQ